MRKWNLGLYVLALLVAACGGGAPAETGEQGPQTANAVLELPLTTTSNGQVYRLVGATFDITGTQQVTVTNTETDTVSVPLAAGSYTIQLNGQWRLERVTSPGVPGEPVQATLISPNPLNFTLAEGQTRAVRFLFKVPGNGNADVGFTVDTGGWITGTLDFTNVPPNEVPAPLNALAGQSVPFTISFATPTLTRQEDSWDKSLHVQAGPITVQFGGPATSALVHDRIAQALETGSQLSFQLTTNSGGSAFFSGFTLTGGSEPFVLHLRAGQPFPAPLDSNGYPAPQPFQFNTQASLSYNGSPSYSMPGVATGDASPQ